MANNLKQYDAFQVLRSVFDIDKNCLRVCVVDGASGGGPIEVIIDHTSDSIRLGDGTTLTTGTNVSGKQGQDVYVINDELDIRSLDALIDNVAIHDADGNELAINPDGSIDTNFAPGSEIGITDGTDSLEVNADGSINVVSTATDLDIRDLTHVSDSVSIGDGTEIASVNASNELNVRDDDSNTTLSAINGKLVDGNDIGDVTVNNAAGASAVNIQDGGNSITVDAVDLDIRDLDASNDNIAISDGVTEVGVTLSNELKVNDSDGNDLLTDIEDNTSPRSTANYALVGVTNTATALNVSGTNLVGRKSITIQPKGSTIYVGFDNTVTSGNNGTGIKVSSGSVITFPYDDTITIYAIKSGGGTANTFVSEDL